MTICPPRALLLFVLLVFKHFHGCQAYQNIQDVILATQGPLNTPLVGGSVLGLLASQLSANLPSSPTHGDDWPSAIGLVH